MALWVGGPREDTIMTCVTCKLLLVGMRTNAHVCVGLTGSLYPWCRFLCPRRFVRIGTLVMFCHDVSDVFLETAKIFNYTSQARAWAQVCDCIQTPGLAIPSPKPCTT